MVNRGTFRGTFTVMLDTDEFQALPERARHLLLTMKQSRINNMAGIFVCRSGEIGILADQTGMSGKDIGLALKDLEKGNWILRSKGLVWIRNQLRFDPGIKLNNSNHVNGVLNVLLGLPNCPLIVKYCDYYDLVYPFDSPPIAPASTDKDKDKEKETDKDKDTEKEKEEESGKPDRLTKPREPKPKDEATPHERFKWWVANNHDVWQELGKASFMTDLEILEEVGKMKAWVLANPVKGNKKDWRKFVGGWFRKFRKDKAEPHNPLTRPQEDKHYAEHRREASKRHTKQGLQHVGNALKGVDKK